jgi:hypothetical protein
MTSEMLVKSRLRLAAFGRLSFHRTRMKVGTLLPHVAKLVTDLTRPLMENVDVVRYTEMSRLLKIAEEYAVRLLSTRYNQEDAERIARRLVEKYPEHGFVIDSDELASFEPELKADRPTSEQIRIMEQMDDYLKTGTAVGRLMEMTP